MSLLNELNHRTEAAKLRKETVASQHINGLIKELRRAADSGKTYWIAGALDKEEFAFLDKHNIKYEGRGGISNVNATTSIQWQHIVVYWGDNPPPEHEDEQQTI